MSSSLSYIQGDGPRAPTGVEPELLYCYASVITTNNTSTLYRFTFTYSVADVESFVLLDIIGRIAIREGKFHGHDKLKVTQQR